MKTTYSFDWEEDVAIEERLETNVEDPSELVVYNDDVNTFDWVIQCLTEILDHSAVQAEQLTLLVHFKGRATVKTDSEKVLKPFKDALVDRGLSAVIEHN